MNAPNNPISLRKEAYGYLDQAQAMINTAVLEERGLKPEDLRKVEELRTRDGPTFGARKNIGRGIGTAVN